MFLFLGHRDFNEIVFISIHYLGYLIRDINDLDRFICKISFLKSKRKDHFFQKNEFSIYTQ